MKNRIALRLPNALKNAAKVFAATDGGRTGIPPGFCWLGSCRGGGFASRCAASANQR